MVEYAIERDAAGALAMLDEVRQKNMTASLVLYNTAIAACQRHWQIALEIFQTLNTIGIQPNNVTYLRAIQACEKSNHWPQAIELIENAKSREGNLLSTKIYNAALRACKKMLQSNPADSLLADMKDRGIRPDLDSYVQVLGAYKRSFDWQRALQLFLELQLGGYKADHRAYANVIKAMEPAKEWQVVHRLLEEARGNLRDLDKNILDNAISVYHAGKQWEIAYSLHDQMLKLSMVPGLLSYNAAIHACVKSKKWQRGIDLLHLMLNQKVMPDSGTCNGVLACCDTGGIESQAWKVIKFMRKHDINMGRSTYISAMGAIRDSSSWERAWSLVCEFENKALKPEVVVYNTPMKIFRKSQDQWKKIVSLFERMSLFGASPNMETYKHYIYAVDCGGRWADALNVLQVLMDNYRGEFDISDYNHVIHACLAAGRWERGLSLIQSIESVTGLNKDILTNSYEIYSLGMLHEYNRVKAAVASLKRELNNSLPLSVYNSIINAYMECGKVEDAEAAQSQLTDQGLEADPYTYDSLVKGYRLNGKFESVVDTLYKCQDKGLELDAEGFDTLIDGHLKMDKWKMALREYREMKGKWVVPLPDTFGKMISLQIQLDDPIQAMETVDDMANSTVKPSLETYDCLLKAAEKDVKWKPILTAIGHLTAGKQKDALRLVRDSVVSFNNGEEGEDPESEKFRKHALRKHENPVDEATYLMGGQPMEEDEVKDKTKGTKMLGVSADPVLSTLQEKKGEVPGIPQNLEQIPLHPDVQLPDKDDPRYAEAVMRSKIRWKDETRRTVYVGNLMPEISEIQLSEFMMTVGMVTCVAPRKYVEQTTGTNQHTYVQSSWFTFVEFENPRDAARSLQLAGYVLGDRPIKMGRANQPIVKSMVPNMALHHLIQSGVLDEKLLKKRQAEKLAEKEALKRERERMPDLKTLRHQLREQLKVIEEHIREDANKKTKDGVYKALEDEVDRLRAPPKTEAEKRKEKEEERKRQRSISRSNREAARKLQAELNKPMPKPKPERKADPHAGRFFNGWAWIPKEQAKDWIAANQVATLHHITHMMTPGMATLRGPEAMLPPGLVASIKHENAKVQGTPQFSGQTPFSSVPPQPRDSTTT